jgi:hypothetical protein
LRFAVLLGLIISQIGYGESDISRSVPLSRGIARPSNTSVLSHENPAGLVQPTPYSLGLAVFTVEDEDTADNEDKFMTEATAYYSNDVVGVGVGVRMNTKEAKDSFEVAGGIGWKMDTLSFGISGVKSASSTEIKRLIFGFHHSPAAELEWGGIFFNAEDAYYHFGLGISYKLFAMVAVGFEILDIRHEDRYEVLPGLLLDFGKVTLGLSYDVGSREQGTHVEDRIVATLSHTLSRQSRIQAYYNHIGQYYLGLMYQW